MGSCQRNLLQESKINNLIKIAESEANKVAGKDKDKTALWDRTFHRAMNRMTSELKLRVL